MILADLGAEVLLVTRTDETDGELRGMGPYVNGRSTYRFSVERGKKNLQLDLKHPEGRELALQLAEKSDVLAENFTPGTMDRLGLGYEAVSRRNPRLIYASCSGHGQTGPYATRGAVDVVAQAMSGLMSVTGEAEGRPMRTGASIGDTVGGTFLAMGVIAALYEREKSGLGQRLDVAMVESLMYNLENAMVRYSATGEIPGRIGPRHPLTTPFQPFETADGWIIVASVRDWEAFCVVIGREQLAKDPRFRGGRNRHAHHAELEPLLIEVFKEKRSAEWMELLEGTCIVAPLYNIAEAMRDPQIQARGAVVEMDMPGPEERRVVLPNNPVRLSRTAPKVDTPAGWVGEHTREVLETILGLTGERVRELEAAGAVRCR
jgi:CoA:oxalate CoA-transferase